MVTRNEDMLCQVSDQIELEGISKQQIWVELEKVGKNSSEITIKYCFYVNVYSVQIFIKYL